MRRAFGPLMVDHALCGVALDALGRLLERAPEEPAPSTADTIEVREVDARPVPDPGPSAFHVGSTQAWVSKDDRILLSGRGRSIVVRGSRVDIWIDPAARWTEAEIEELALVDLACALFLAARAYGLWHVHAACVVDPVLGSLLIVGQSGSGKSTTTLAFLTDGARWLSDDTVLIHRVGDGIQVYGVPRLFHVSEATLAFFPGLEGACLPHRRSLLGKRCLDPEVAFPDAALGVPMAPVLILLPEVEGQQTRGEPGSAADALGALLESSTWVTIEGLPGNGEHLESLALLAGATCCVRLQLAADIFGQPGRLRSAILEAGGSADHAPCGSARPF